MLHGGRFPCYVCCYFARQAALQIERRESIALAGPFCRVHARLESVFCLRHQSIVCKLGPTYSAQSHGLECDVCAKDSKAQLGHTDYQGCCATPLIASPAQGVRKKFFNRPPRRRKPTVWAGQKEKHIY